MRHINKRCIHCNAVYAYQASGSGCFRTDNNKDYCPDCQTSINEVLSNIPVKFQKVWEDCSDYSLEGVKELNNVKKIIEKGEVYPSRTKKTQVNSFREASLVTYEDALVDYSIGSSGSVEFNFDNVWGFSQQCEGFDPNKLSFYHTHPNSFPQYSEMDREVIKGYTLALGGTFNFYIVYFSNSRIYDLSCGSLLHYYDKESDKIVVESMWVDDFKKLLILKLLSYGKFNLIYFST